MRFRLIASLAVIAALAVACGDANQAAPADPPPTTTQAPEPAAPPTTQAPEPTAPPTTQAPEPAAPPTTQAPPTTPAPPPGLPGSAYDRGPASGAALGVVGVAFDDVLNVRRAPGTDNDIVRQLDPIATDVVATGRARQLDGGSIWVEVDAHGIVGWANVRFLAPQADTYDATAAVVQHLGERPTAATMAELGRIVADGLHPHGEPKVILVAPPQGEHDFAEVTYDIIGFEDDSVLGARLHVFGRVSDDRQSFSLHSVEETPFCARGIAPEGLCV